MRLFWNITIDLFMLISGVATIAALVWFMQVASTPMGQ